MKKLNPLYFVFLFFIIMISSVFTVNMKKNSLNEKKTDYKEIQEKAIFFNDLNTKWENVIFVNKKIDTIINSDLYKNEKISKILSQNLLKLTIESKNQEKLNKFLNEILNSELIIKEVTLGNTLVIFEIGVDK